MEWNGTFTWISVEVFFFFFTSLNVTTLKVFLSFIRLQQVVTASLLLEFFFISKHCIFSCGIANWRKEKENKKKICDFQVNVFFCFCCYFAFTTSGISVCVTLQNKIPKRHNANTQTSIRLP